MSEDNDTYQRRDQILGEIHKGVSNLEEWCTRHDEKDDRRFADVNQKLIYGAIAIVIVAFASGVLGQLISHIKVGV